MLGETLSLYNLKNLYIQIQAVVIFLSNRPNPMSTSIFIGFLGCKWNCEIYFISPRETSKRPGHDFRPDQDRARARDEKM